VDVVAPTNAGSDRVKTRNETAQKKRAAFFLSCSFFLCCEVPVERREEAFSADDRLEQPSGTKEATGGRPLDCLLLFLP